MFNLKSWLNRATNPQDYIWINVILLKETPKAILIEFDDKEIWLPKAWIKAIVPGATTEQPLKGIPISLKISQYHWAKVSQ